ncbi:MAG TPA: GntR family transcriptional regulator [Methylomirabilota bacterium]|jgi:DNA-binding GntR family transcriptional regulator|nr:GntR family transcriptional regulator [Methylomirabilota bacterium]
MPRRARPRLLRPRRRPPAAPPAPAPPAAAHALFPAPLEHQTLEELAYRRIRRALVEGQLAPGQRIVASAVAKAGGISRIPVMQALRRLESEGFVRINPHKDVVVATLSPEEFRERFLLMAALEALCVREADGKIAPAVLKRLRALQEEIIAARAAGNTARAVAADSDFHRVLWETSGLRQVVQVLQNVWDRGEYYRVIMHARRGGFAKESLVEHEEILEALEAQDAARAAKAIERHRLQAMKRLAETT